MSNFMPLKTYDDSNAFLSFVSEFFSKAKEHFSRHTSRKILDSILTRACTQRIRCMEGTYERTREIYRRVAAL